MGYAVKILADSIGPSGKRLTTFELTYPRMVHAELMTHRVFSRNAASSRAIPVEKLIRRVLDDPVLPVYWGKNQSGMSADVELEGAEREAAILAWLLARDEAVASARRLIDLKVHKQLANRIIEPWMFITVILSATDLGNWFNLRTHAAAQPEIKYLADMMAVAYFGAAPQPLAAGQWHLPFIRAEEQGLTLAQKKRLATGRVARVSYLTQDGRRDLEADYKLHDRLAESGHWSPFEHIAQAMNSPRYYGNFAGWKQYRKSFKTENRVDFLPATLFSELEASGRLVTIRTALRAGD